MESGDVASGREHVKRVVCMHLAPLPLGGTGSLEIRMLRGWEDVTKETPAQVYFKSVSKAKETDGHSLQSRVLFLQKCGNRWEGLKGSDFCSSLPHQQTASIQKIPFCGKWE